jgi:hypothetical protein
MTLKNKISVEQLDDERLTNIERKLVVAVSEMRAPEPLVSRRLLAFAGVAMACGLAAFVGYKLRPTDAPVVATVEETPQTFALNTDKANTVTLGDTTLTASAGTDLVVNRTKQRVVIDMRRGSLDLVVAHDPSRLLVVRAGDTEIEDIGTRFVVDYDGKHNVAVRVTEGEVKVKRAGKHENLKVGDAWTSERGKLTIAALDAIATAVVPAPGHVDPTLAPPTPTERSAAESGSNAGTGSATPPEAGSNAPQPKPRTGGKSNAKAALEKLPIEEPLDVGTKDMATAISKYLELAVSMGDNTDKTQVLYSMAVVQHRARQDKAALYTLSGVIKRQGGKAYKEALWLNVRIECMQRFDDECRQAADLYLRKIPDGVAAGVAQTILTEIARAQ